MSVKAHHAITSLYQRCFQELKQFSANHREMEKFSEAYFRYRDLLREQRERAPRILKIFGVLGVYSPDTSEELAHEIKRTIGVPASEPISSSDIRDRLKLWEILELFLSAVDDKATIGDFRDFLFSLGIREGVELISTQAVNSALKTHPEIFEEASEGGQKFIMLRSRDGLLAAR
jgi:hypothetical protein